MGDMAKYHTDPMDEYPPLDDEDFDRLEQLERENAYLNIRNTVLEKRIKKQEKKLKRYQPAIDALKNYVFMKRPFALRVLESVGKRILREEEKKSGE